jgi:hypothetical protein
MELFRETARKMGVHEAIVEKDFWVCWILDVLFSSGRWSDKLIFKGGTSLSKVFGVISRFSEDIDLVLDWRELGYGTDDPWQPDSGSQRTRFVELTREKTVDYLADQMIPSLNLEFELALGDRLELFHRDHVIAIEYPRAFSNPAIVPQVLLEIGPLASWTPHGEFTIRSYASEVFPEVFRSPQVHLQAVTAERTFWEKATILHQEAHRAPDKPMPSRYSRHYYDLFCLCRTGHYKEALKQKALLAQVVEFKERFYRTPWSQLTLCLEGKLRLVPPPERLENLADDYQKMRAMLFGSGIPVFSEIMSRLSDVETEINSRLS